MNPFAFIPLIAFLFNTVMWTAIISKRQNTRLQLSFLIYVTILAGFVFTEFLAWKILPESWSFFVLRVQSIFWIFLGTSFLNFVYVLLELKRPKWFYWLFLSSFVATGVALFSPWVIASPITYYWAYGYSKGALFLPFVGVFVLALPIYALYLIRKSYLKTVNRNLRNQYLLISVGTVIALSIGLLTDVILPEVFGIHSVIHLGALSTVIQSVFIFIAVHRFRFLSISVNQSAQYLFRNVQDGVLILDNKGCITLANQSAKKILCLTYYELYGNPLSNYVQDYEYSQSYESETLVLEHINKSVLISQCSVSHWNVPLGKLVIIHNLG